MVQAVYVNPFGSFLAGARQRRQDDESSLRLLTELRARDQEFRRNEALNPIQIEQARFNLEVDQQFTPTERAEQIRNLTTRTAGTASSTAARDALLPGQVTGQNLQNAGALQDFLFNQRTADARARALGLANEGAALRNQGQSIDNRFNQEANPFRVQGLALANQGTGLRNRALDLQNEFDFSANPLRLRGLNLANEGAGLRNAAQNFDNQFNLAANPIRLRGLETDTARAEQQLAADAPFFGVNAEANTFRNVSNAVATDAANQVAVARNQATLPLVPGQVQRQEQLAQTIFSGREAPSLVMERLVNFGNRQNIRDGAQAGEFRLLVRRSGLTPAQEEQVFSQVPGFQEFRYNRRSRRIGGLADDERLFDRNRVGGFLGTRFGATNTATLRPEIAAQLQPQAGSAIANALGSGQVQGLDQTQQLLLLQAQIAALLNPQPAAPQNNTLEQLTQFNAAGGR